jgi:hypothetical protein
VFGAPSAMEGGDDDDPKGEEDFFEGAPPRRLFIVKDAGGSWCASAGGKILNLCRAPEGHNDDNTKTNECSVGSAKGSTSLRENRSTARQPGNKSTLDDASVPISCPET